MDVPQPFVAVSDIAAAAAAAFADPAYFHTVELELAGEVRSLRDVAEILSAAWGRTITLSAPPATTDDGLPAPFVVSQTYLSARPAPARPEYAKAFGLPVTTVEVWARVTRP
ncbi:NmrA family NAD(P)-binding protein [Pseudonocardia sulfidoxydans]|uniref:NmrA family NAD(P)-binding protein n=1 Tax=Pseudonocardia sulfidoxydans TaxID=54011 RepID=UPI0024824F5D|nr:NmrA family NAD(P)-binding protein [Pseudonocardia sulfidoxydans]